MPSRPGRVSEARALGAEPRPSTVFLLLMVIAACVTPARAAAATEHPASLHGAQAIESLRRDGSYDSLAASFTRARYAIRRRDAGSTTGPTAYEAHNPAEDFRATFTPTGVQLHASGARAWQMGVELTGYGYGENVLGVGSGTIEAGDNRIEIRKQIIGHSQTPPLVEWYVNTPRGLEQGFTLAAPPPRDAPHDRTARGRLRLVLQLTGDLHAEAIEDGRAAALKDRSGRRVSTYAHLEAWDATGRKLAAEMHVGPREIALAIDDTGATYPVTVDPTFGDKQVQLFANDGAAFDDFGDAVAVSGDTAVVGARSEDGIGAAYVFVRSGGTWVQHQKLTQEDGFAGDHFGFSVAISANTIVVGATGVDLPKAGGGFDDDVGAAYVYVRNGAMWSLTPERLTPSDGGPFFSFGGSVAISDDTVIVGVNSAAGRAYVFAPSGSTWVEQKILTGELPLGQGGFGVAVAISGNTAMIAGNDAATLRGAVFFFVRTGITWALQQKVQAADHLAGDEFGLRAIAIDGDTAVVGYKSNPDIHRNGAYVFVRKSGVWSQQAKLAAGATLTNVFNINPSVGISGNTAIVGFPEDSPIFQSSAGSVFVYARAGTSWRVVEHLYAGVANDNFGLAVAVSGDHAIIGTRGHDVGGNLNQGTAYLFSRPSDLDGDALPDDWESKGITVDAAGKVVGTGDLVGQGTFIDLKAMGSNPLHKDLFVHADWMQPNPGPTPPPPAVFKPSLRAIKMVIDAFARAPVDNPDNKRGIRLHVDLGADSLMKPGATWGPYSRANVVPFQSVLGTLDMAGDYNWAGVDALKLLNFAPARRGAVFHYAVFANDYAGANTSSGLSRDIPGADFMVTLGLWTPRGGTEKHQAGTFMHEFGHNLGLRHGGDEDLHNKPNYLSIMNYSFQTTGLLRANGKQQEFDYSREKLPDLNEKNLDENVGISDPAGHLTLWGLRTRSELPPGNNKCLTSTNYTKTFFPSPALDWNCDGVKNAAAITTGLDINGDGVCVSPGTNNTIDSSVVGDDDVRQRRVVDGANRKCETVAGGDDRQELKVNTTETDVLTGFKDWTALVWDGGGKIGSAKGTGLPDTMNTPLDEPTMEEILDFVPPELLDAESLAPLDVVTAAPESGGAPLTVDFDGSGSTAVDPAVVVDWAWDFGDGTTGSGALVQHTYDTPGEYFASLTVTDDGGHVNLVPLETLITVEEPAPTATATPTPAASSVASATPLLTPTVTATTTVEGPPIPTATPATPSVPTPTPLTTATPLATPSPHPTSTPLGVGDVDPAFHPTVTSVFARRVDAVVTQPDHKIIVGGDFASFAGCARRNIARLNPDGSCDASFDPGLALTFVIQNQVPGSPGTFAGTRRVDSPVKALALQADGKIFVGMLGGAGFQNGVNTHSRIIVRLNSDGTLDSSFNTVGVAVGFGSAQSVNAIVVQGDGKILIGGGFTYSNGKTKAGVPFLDGAIARLNDDGSVDSSFVVPDGQSFGGPNGAVLAIALQPDGRVIIGGIFSQVAFTIRYGIARLNGDGSLDTGYNVYTGTQNVSGFGFVTSVAALALRPDGKLVVGGALRPSDGNPSNFVNVARLNADGSRDAGFTDWRKADVFALLRQADGKILIGGSFRATDPVERNSIARLDADGGVDPTFDTPGMTAGVYTNQSNDVGALALQGDGSIVVVGRFDNFDHEPAENIVQLASNGSRDPNFDSNGAGTGLQVYALARQPDGKLLVGYQSNAGPNRSTRLNSARTGGIGRLNPDGTTDATFTSPFDPNATVFGIALQPDGKVIVGGSFRLIGSDQNMDFARLNADGTLDAGFVLPGPDVHLGNNTGFAVQADGKILAYEANIFGGQGKLVRLNANGSRDDTFAFPTHPVGRVVVQSDGKILLTSQFARLQRLNADGSVDATFDPGTGPNFTVNSIIPQADGKILIGGFFSNYDGTPRQQIARVNADGSLDTGFVPATPYAGLEVRALALQPDGKVFVGTDFFQDPVLGRVPRVFRLAPDGSLDESFPQDGTGIAYIGFATGIHTLLLQPDDGLIVGGRFDVVDDVARLGLVRLLGSTPPAPGVGLDSFVFYKVKASKGAAKFAPLGPLTLADAAATNDVDVTKVVALGLPATVNAQPRHDGSTHLTDYLAKGRKSPVKFRPLADVRVQTPCSDLVVTVKAPEHLLMPALVDAPNPAPPTADTHEVADFRCYKVKVQKKRADGTPAPAFPKGVQLDAGDDFQSRRYDLKKLTRVCYPVAESGVPVTLKTGVPIAFTPAALRHETVHLACYQAKPAKKSIAQNGCGPLDPKDKGTKIVPPPAKHQPQRALRTSTQLGAVVLDTAKEVEVCIPSTLSPP